MLFSNDSEQLFLGSCRNEKHQVGYAVITCPKSIFLLLQQYLSIHQIQYVTLELWSVDYTILFPYILQLHPYVKIRMIMGQHI